MPMGACWEHRDKKALQDVKGATGTVAKANAKSLKGIQLK